MQVGFSFSHQSPVYGLDFVLVLNETMFALEAGEKIEYDYEYRHRLSTSTKKPAFINMNAGLEKIWFSSTASPRARGYAVFFSDGDSENALIRPSTGSTSMENRVPLG